MNLRKTIAAIKHWWRNRPGPDDEWAVTITAKDWRRYRGIYWGTYEEALAFARTRGDQSPFSDADAGEVSITVVRADLPVPEAKVRT